MHGLRLTAENLTLSLPFQCLWCSDLGNIRHTKMMRFVQVPQQGAELSRPITWVSLLPLQDVSGS